MTGFFIAFLLVFIGFGVLLAVLGRMRHQTGGGWGPTEFSDGSMTTQPTGYPEEMKGRGKRISPTDNNAARF